MIYYPLSVLMMGGVREILIISTPEDTPRFQKLFGNGSDLGLSIQYAIQAEPNGLAQAFIIAESFIDGPVALILGDNIFYGEDLPALMKKGTSLSSGGLIFGYHVKDPHRYGVVEFDKTMQVVGLEEKPLRPHSSYAVPGLYFYGADVVSLAKTLRPSLRGELEITDLNRIYLEQRRLTVQILGKGHAWLDTGTFDSFQKASLFVQTIQERQGIQIACIEEIAYRQGFINQKELSKLADRYVKNDYGDYLRQIVLEEIS
jgi:glucose-1-phosphate thymidylyltransferase